jgi:predicted metal-dependent phosphoesterase TrpH
MLRISDLHLHTTASDGRCTPAANWWTVRRARGHRDGGTDHDTVAAIPRFSRRRGVGIDVIRGIEITASKKRRDVHMLGYFMIHEIPNWRCSSRKQRAQRIARVEALGLRLAQLGMPIDIAPLLMQAPRATRTFRGRPRSRGR